MATATVSTRSVIEGFARSHDPSYFAEDAVYVNRPLPEPFKGREAIAGMLNLFYHGAFSDSGADLHTVAADEEKGIGVIEFTFKGRHTGDLMGIPGTNRDVRIPMMAIYEIEGDQIRNARLYYDMADFMRQLGKI